MQGFNPELKIGMQAMIINVTQPQNAHLIGTMVTIEDLRGVGESVQQWYEDIYTVLPLKVDMAIVTGIGTGKHHKEGYSTIQQRHLMPLPPLDDDVIILATEKPKETEKC